MCQEFKIQSEVVPRIASGFGGGMGNTGAVCGAVIGAVMAIGLIKERGSTMEDWSRQAAVVQTFRRGFEDEVGTISCRELTEADLSTAEGQEQFMNSDKPQLVCFPAVGLAYRLVLELLREPL